MGRTLTSRFQLPASKRGTSWAAAILVVLMGSAVGILAGTYLAVWLPTMKATNTGIDDLFRSAIHGERYVRILMIGEDDTARRRKNGNGLSDTLVVVALDTETKDVRALSIPRDTLVEIPNHGTCKINAAHVYGGPQLTKQVVQDLLGVPIEYYIKTNTHGLRGMVDLVGGVYIKIDKNMRYTDRRGGLYINLNAGRASRAQYLYQLQGPDLNQLFAYAPLMQRLADEGRKLAIYDRATGLYAYWYLQMRAEEEMSRAGRYHKPLSVASFWCSTKDAIERTTATLAGTLRALTARRP